ncbi:hypothetical protein, conserved [Eimeria acervulina]|uniref:Cytidyltransferase-like domain-containing protein n=1 Tax=Eimeria acervulina TaxID=5801 RepID=U6GC95_EIMAC|nr:hypothetical protein, conserved [Eimeria acervulina]CDI77147.1 hypothetical protein, conserved [Eimeria acervulina]
MDPATFCCFQEDAACTIIDEGVVHRLAPAGADGSADACAEQSCELDKLVLFLGRALLLTRRALYVLLCVPAEAQTASSPDLSNKSQYDAHGHRFGDAATLVSCGVQAWHLILYLNTKVGSLARRLGLTAVPFIIPWERETPHEQAPPEGPTLACTHWVERARAAVLHHYLLSVGSNVFWQYADEAALANAVPLVVDNVSAFSSSVACELWPRHCHLSPLRGSIQAGSSEHASLVEVEDRGISRVQHLALANQESRRRVAAHGVSQGFCGVVSRVDNIETNARVKVGAPFGYTLVAGTFDRLHAGHQLLLAAAALSAQQRIGVAVASGPLIKRKMASQENVAAAGIEHFAFRLQAAVAFVQLVAASRGRAVRLTGFKEALVEEEASLSDELQLQSSHLGGSNQFGRDFSSVVEAFTSPVEEALGDSLQLEVFRITDAVGPADRIAFDCLVVSDETVKGADMVNRIRGEAGNEPVSVLTVGLVPTNAWIVHQVAEALAEHLPFPLLREGSQLEQKCGFSRLAGGTVQSKAPVEAEEEEGQNTLTQNHRNPAAESLDTFRSKLSSTVLRQQQLKRLCCGSIAELYKRFQAAWLWLEGSESEAGVSELQSCATIWSVLCAEHAAPWRRFYTFDRVARVLERLDALNTSAKREPIVLSVFLGSLLACPCQYITLTRRACRTSNARELSRTNGAHSCTLASWSPEAEDAAWQKSAAKLLAELQCRREGRPCVVAHNIQQATRKMPPASSFASNDVLLEGRFYMLKSLLWGQRAAAYSRLAPTVEAVNAPRGKHAPAWNEGEMVTLMRLARRLEQLEFADGSMEEATRLRRLRQEYFFVSEDCFSRHRMKQLAELLESASSLDCLNGEELRHARASAERELNILTNRILHDEPTASC